MQNDDATDFDNSFLYTPQLQCEEAIYAKRIIEEVSLVTENDVQSANHMMVANKREKVEKYKFGREKPAKSTETIHETFKHDATMDFVERMKENDQKLVERQDFEVYGVDDGVMVFVSSEKFFEESDDVVDDANISRNMMSLAWINGDKYFIGIWKPPDNKQKEFEKFVKVHWKRDNSEMKRMIKWMTMICLSTTTNFLLKMLMWTKVTMKRMQQHIIFATGRVLEGVAHIPCTPCY